METLLIRLGAILFSAASYRIRGMGFATTYSRLLCLALTASSVTLLLAVSADCPWWLLLSVFIASFGTESLGHSKGMNYGSETGTTADAFTVLLVTGAATGLPSVLALVFLGDYVAAVLAAATYSLKPVAYYIGWEIPSKIKDLETGGPLGELLTGFTRGLYLVV